MLKMAAAGAMALPVATSSAACAQTPSAAGAAAGSAEQPVYQTLTPDQTRRLGFLAVFVLRELRSGVEQRRLLDLDCDG